MNKPDKSQVSNKDREEQQRSGPSTPNDRHPPADTGRTSDDAPDDAVEGRDRLSENEDRLMDPGVSDSTHS